MLLDISISRSIASFCSKTLLSVCRNVMILWKYIRLTQRVKERLRPHLLTLNAFGLVLTALYTPEKWQTNSNGSRSYMFNTKQLP